MTSRIVKHRRIPLLVAAIVATTLVVVTQGAAQSEKKGPANLFKSMPTKRDEPIRISSATLEVRDKSKMAMFKGDVIVIQGDTNVRCNELVVFYEGERGAPGSKAAPAPPPKSGAPVAGGPAGGQQIRRMEARGSVVVTQKDQRAVGDRAEFDMRTNTVTLIGNVVITSADNVARGERMTVDLNTGFARMGLESGGGRVEMLVNPKSAPPKPGKQN
ncbi:MAG TPA: LptA/OstA family protein [Xanthobacteraceae bacterium]|nr:LptA/OstA family protein [Xanthobacteraceae bacterium]